MTERDDMLDLALREACLLNQRAPELPEPQPGDPEDEALLLVLEGSASETELAPMREAVERSCWARERLASLREAMEESLSPSEQLHRTQDPPSQPRLRISFAWARGCLQYLWGTLEPRTVAAVPVATRSGIFRRPTEETSFFDFAHLLGDIQMVIQVERANEDRLDVQLTFNGERDRIRRLRVTLANREGTLLDSQPVEHGRTRFTALEPLPHDLLITTAQRELGRVRLDVLPG